MVCRPSAPNTARAFQRLALAVVVLACAVSMVACERLGRTHPPGVVRRHVDVLRDAGWTVSGPVDADIGERPDQLSHVRGPWTYRIEDPEGPGGWVRFYRAQSIKTAADLDRRIPSYSVGIHVGRTYVQAVLRMSGERSYRLALERELDRILRE